MCVAVNNLSNQMHTTQPRHSTDRNSLVRRECALTNGGFEVISVESEIQTRFGIEMGRSAVLSISFRASAATTQELSIPYKVH
jgi:hypothetical protein